MRRGGEAQGMWAGWDALRRGMRAAGRRRLGISGRRRVRCARAACSSLPRGARARGAARRGPWLHQWPAPLPPFTCGPPPFPPTHTTPPNRQTSAAMTSASLLFRKSNVSYADQLLRKATELYSWGAAVQGEPLLPAGGSCQGGCKRVQELSVLCRGSECMQGCAQCCILCSSRAAAAAAAAVAAAAAAGQPAQPPWLRTGRGCSHACANACDAVTAPVPPAAAGLYSESYPGYDSSLCELGG